MFELRQSFFIESARFLPKLPKNHPCSRVHGHSFYISLVWRGPKDSELGWVQDYHEVRQIAESVLTKLDHQLLNDIEDLSNPTTENIAEYLFCQLKQHIPQLKQIIIKETSNTECRYPIID